MSKLQKITSLIEQFKELSTKTGVSTVSHLLDFALAHYRHGVYPHQYLHSDFHKYRNAERKNILTFGRWDKMVRDFSNPASIHYLQNKIDFNRKFHEFVKREWVASDNLSEAELQKFLSDKSEIIVKPVDSWEGEGIKRLKVADIDSHQLHSQLAKGRFIIEDVISNCQELKLGKSLNTLRITTLNIDGEIYLIKPFLRAGIGDSDVDNYNAGGVEYEIDAETGIIVGKGFCQGEEKCVFHPLTDITMPGRKIPHWEEAVALVKGAHSIIPECKYIGWDVALTPDHIELIEGNHDAGFFGFEYFGTTGWWKILRKGYQNKSWQK